MKHLKKLFLENIYTIILTAFALVFLIVNIRINSFRYNNFDFGKFDLGNMTQMVWNTLHGRPLYLTDYFGTNLPRWAMSHVDPILLLFVPIFAIIPHPMTLVYSQILLIISCAFLIYFIANLELKSKLSACLLGVAFLFYPAVGFLTAWTGFHGVSAVMPFILAAFYVFELMHKSQNFSKTKIILFWMFLVLTMAGKEQLPLYVILYGVFVIFFRSGFKNFKVTKKWFLDFLKLTSVKLGLSMVVVGIIWFVMCFFVIIPHYAHYRIEGFQRFSASLGSEEVGNKQVDLPNYFLSRYDAFGDSYSDVIKGIILKPDLAISIIFGGKTDNMIQTLMPVGFLPFAYPVIFIFAIPDLLINYLTSAGGIGTGEITNHRISMIIPILFLAVIYAISYLSKLLGGRLKKFKHATIIIAIVLSGYVLGMNVYTTFKYNNPVYQWLSQALIKRVFAKTDDAVSGKNLQVGDVVKLSPLENKDRECANKIVKMIPDNVSVSGPDYLGAHLSMRETYAIFPGLYNEADYVIVDVFSKKITSILEADFSLVTDTVEKVIKDPNYKLESGCGNLFVFKKVGSHNKNTLLPIQERYQFNETMSKELFQSLYVVDFKMPKDITRGENKEMTVTYRRQDGSPLADYVLFLTFINDKTDEIYQLANLPSFSIKQPSEWENGLYYTENLELAIPDFVEAGSYKVFIGMTNVIRTRSMYLGNMEVK